MGDNFPSVPNAKAMAREFVQGIRAEFLGILATYVASVKPLPKETTLEFRARLSRSMASAGLEVPHKVVGRKTRAYVVGG